MTCLEAAHLDRHAGDLTLLSNVFSDSTTGDRRSIGYCSATSTQANVFVFSSTYSNKKKVSVYFLLGTMIMMGIEAVDSTILWPSRKASQVQIVVVEPYHASIYLYAFPFEPHYLSQSLASQPIPIPIAPSSKSQPKTPETQPLKAIQLEYNPLSWCPFYPGHYRLPQSQT